MGFAVDADAAEANVTAAATAANEGGKKKQNRQKTEVIN